MQKDTLVRILLLAGSMALGWTAQTAETVSWFDGGLDAAWPANATGGTWYCQNMGQLKWKETSVPGVATKAAGVTLDNWAYVGLRFTATKPVNLGLGGGVTEARFSTKLLLAPLMKDNMPKIESDDKGGVILVHEDDGTLRYYVVAQDDEANGTGTNAWKVASSLPAVKDDTVPVTIGIFLHQDGQRWLVDYTVDGVAEVQRVVSIGGLAPTLSQLRYTGPCTVQALSASYGRYPAWLNTDDPTELAKYDVWAAKYDVADVAEALQCAYLLDCANTPEAIAAAKLTTVTAWFDGGVDAQWPNHSTGGRWSDIGTRAWFGVSQGVGLESTGAVMTFAAEEALAFDTQEGAAGATVTTRVTFVPHAQLPAVDADDVTGIALLQEPSGVFRYHVIAQEDETAGTGGNVWKPTSDLPVLAAAPTEPVTVSVRVYRKGGRCHADYTVGGAGEPSHVVAGGSSPTLGRVCYAGAGTLAYLAATLGDETAEPHVHGWQVTAADSLLTATCTNADCFVASATLSLSGAHTKTADGEPLTVALAGGSAFVVKTGATVGPIGYYQGDEALPSAPTAVGAYEARVSVWLEGHAYTLTYALTITEPSEDDPADPDAPPTEPEPPSGPTQMFYIGTTGFASWADAMGAAKAGDTVSVGANAELKASAVDKSVTIDLCGRSLNITGGWWPIAITVVDTGTPAGSGRLEFSAGSLNIGGGTMDVSSLAGSQLSGTFWGGNNSATLLKYPGDLSLKECASKIAGMATGMKIVVQGVTYTYDGNAKTWIADTPLVPTLYAITITSPENGTLETSVTNGVAFGTTVTVTATPAAGYRLKSLTVNGLALTGTTFAMPSENVTVAATFEEMPMTPEPPSEPTEPTQMFYIGTTGYANWSDAMGAAKAGDKVTVGTNASFTAVWSDKAVTIDLCGRTLSITGGWWPVAMTVIDTGKPAGRLVFSNGSLNVGGGAMDFSDLSGSQFSGTCWIGGRADTTVKFPGDLSLNECTSKLGNPGNGMKIVVQGVTYVYDGQGNAWGQEGPSRPDWINLANAAKYDVWAAKNGVSDPATALPQAYLLNCANTSEAVDASKAVFKIPGITVRPDGTVEVAQPEGAFNGTVTIMGCEAVNGTYHEQTSRDRFFKAVLDL